MEATPPSLATQFAYQTSLKPIGSENGHNGVMDFQEVLEQNYESCEDDRDGWYRCNRCGIKIYYSDSIRRNLVEHEAECGD